MNRSTRLLRTVAKQNRAWASARPTQQISRPLVLRSPQLCQSPRSIPSFSSRRWNSSLAVPESESAKQSERPSEPSYQLTFTCKPCQHRSSHVITKHGYHKGTVLIQCPNCKSRHVISDHLKIFMDRQSTLEDILKETAGSGVDLSKLLKKGRLGIKQGELVGVEGDEDIEFWDDGSQTKHTPANG